jgi:hypothetical protein
MVYIGVKKAAGKKSPRRLGKRLVVIHGTRFKYREKVYLSDEFAKEAGLDDPQIRKAVIKSIAQNYGVFITAYEEDKDRQQSQPKQKKPTPPSPEPKKETITPMRTTANVQGPLEREKP